MLRVWCGAALMLTVLFATANMALSRAQETTFMMNPNWQIIYATNNRGQSTVINVMNLDGSDVQHLEVDRPYPDCSPDGNYLVYLVDNQIHVASSNGEIQHPVNPSPNHITSDLSVSNDGKEIVFYGVLAETWGNYVTNVETNEWFWLGEGSPIGISYGFDLSPDGSHIAYYIGEVGPPNPNLFAISIDGTLEVELSAPAVDPDWSPDGSMITFSANWDGNFDIYVLDVGHSIIMQLTHQQMNFDNRYPVWSPDGHQIMFVNINHTLDRLIGDLYLMNADGSSQRALTDPSTKAEWGCFLTARPESLVSDS